MMGSNSEASAYVFWVNPGVIELVLALGNFEKACALLEGLVAEAGNLFEHSAIANHAARIAKFDNFLREACIDT